MTDTNFCQLRTLAQQTKNPLTRFTPVSPYDGSGHQFTKLQLDMRRKAEILKYSANKSSTQTNNLTKKQSFALLSRGSLKNVTQTSLQSGGALNCDQTNFIPIPSSSSGVPGPVVYLYEDPAVPLYNYSNYNSRTYPSYIPNTNAPWQLVTYSDISLNSQTAGNLFYLILSNFIDRPIYNYDVTVPVGLSISGTRLSGSKPDNIFVNVQYMSLSVYYGTSLVTTIRNPGVGNYTGLNIGFDVENNSPGPFQIVQYLGNLGVSNIQLFTSPTYVYSFIASFGLFLYTDSLTYPLANDLVNAYFGTSGLKIQLVANISPSTNSFANNCNVSIISEVSASTFNMVNPGASLVEHA